MQSAKGVPSNRKSAGNAGSQPRRDEHKWLKIIFIILFLLALIITFIVALPYRDWLLSRISCGTNPVLGVSGTANGDFGFTGKLAILPSDPDYSKNIVPNSYWYHTDVIYFCNEQTASNAGYLTHRQ